MLRKILVATDGSAGAQKAVEYAKGLAIGMPTIEVTVLFVKNVYNSLGHAEALVAVDKLGINAREIDGELAERALDKAKEVFRGSDINIKLRSEEGAPASVIVEVADREEFDLVILGNRGLNNIEELYLGSVSERVTKRAKTNVLVVK